MTPNQLSRAIDALPPGSTVTDWRVVEWARAYSEQVCEASDYPTMRRVYLREAMWTFRLALRLASV